MLTANRTRDPIRDSLAWASGRLPRRQCLSAAGGLILLWLLTACTGAPTSLSQGSLRLESAPPISIRPPKLDMASANVVNVTKQIASSPSAPHRLQLPSIDVDTAVVELGWHAAVDNDNQIFSEWDVAEYAAGWHKNSARPGEIGNIVLSGHNNILGAVFRRLDQIEEGDEVILWSADTPHAYFVDRVMIVPEKYAKPEQRAKNARWIGEFDDERLTMVSCWPRNDNTHRIIVIARPQTKLQASSRQ